VNISLLLYQTNLYPKEPNPLGNAYMYETSVYESSPLNNPVLRSTASKVEPRQKHVDVEVE